MIVETTPNTETARLSPLGTIALIDINLVDENSNNSKVYDVDTTQDGYLIGLLKEHRQLEPVQVFKRGERYITHKGNRRLRCLKAMGEKFIKAIIIPECATPEIEMIEMVVDNHGRKKNNKEILREADVILNILKKPKKDREALLETFGNDKFEKAGYVIGVSGSKLRDIYDIRRAHEDDKEFKNLDILGQVLSNKMAVDKGKKILERHQKIKKVRLANGARTKVLAGVTNHWFVHNGPTHIKQLPDGCVQTDLNSPPYWGLKNYDPTLETQLGHEKDPETFIQRLVRIYRETHRVLHPTGSLFVIIGDTIKDKLHVCIPERFCAAMQKNGWFVVKRNIILKSHPTPGTSSYEMCYHFAKSGNYYYEPYKFNFGDVRITPAGGMQNMDGTKSPKTVGLSENCDTFNDVWDLGQIRTEFKEERNRTNDLSKISAIKHECPMPYEYCYLPIITTSQKGDLCIDSFTGTGTTAVICLEQQRNFIGWELKKEYHTLCVDDLTNKFGPPKNTF